MFAYKDDINISHPMDLTESEARSKEILMGKLKSLVIERYALLGIGRQISDMELNVNFAVTLAFMDLLSNVC
jgi:hypothetical protein